MWRARTTYLREKATGDKAQPERGGGRRPGGRSVVIESYKRIAALEQLGRDTVEAVLWPIRTSIPAIFSRLTVKGRCYAPG